ncbi:MAG: hypothetical protein CL843_14490 [Crocinitomicaceae bacterium]|nr:hypothetical protein [Crocinitomicaceae bacterium]|tara:strand:+ start:1407 stop:2573 length:1167 start_codon:yes stop_codon:yes gene_type:complete
MKKLILAAGMFLAIGSLSAQSNKVISASNYLKYYQTDPENSAQDLLNAKENIDDAAQHEKTMNEPKTHIYKGKIYQQLFLAKGEQFAGFKNAQTLEASIDAFNFAMENADRRTDTKELKNLQGMNADLAFKTGISYYQNQEFDKAAALFQQRADIMSALFERIDTVSIFNVGLCAEQTENFDLALEKYKQCAELGYNGASMYASIATIYSNQEKYDDALAALKEGREQYPNEVALLTQEINIYLKQGRTDEALANLNTAIEKEPDNDSYYYARATLYDKKGETENAMADYQKAIEINAENFDANYNLGAIYVNRSSPLVEKMNNLPASADKEYEAIKVQLQETYSKAIPYLEKAHEINPKDLATMQTLLELYVKTNQTEKYMELKKSM